MGNPIRYAFDPEQREVGIREWFNPDGPLTRSAVIERYVGLVLAVLGAHPPSNGGLLLREDRRPTVRLHQPSRRMRSMVDADRTPSGSPETSQAQQAPGGGTSRGPEFGTGGEPQVPVPPYDELRGAPGENTASKAFDAANAPEPGPEPSVSDEERDGVSGTETNPEPALGVGESSGRRAEDLAPDRPDTGTKGADRPVGTTDGEQTDSAGGQVS